MTSHSFKVPLRLFYQMKFKTKTTDVLQCHLKFKTPTDTGVFNLKAK